MTRCVILCAVIIALAICAVCWVASLHSAALDARAAAEIEAIRARAEGESVVVTVPGPVRVVERERVVVRRVAPGAVPIASAKIETTTAAAGAPVLPCPSPLSPDSAVRCPSPEFGCRTAITGWHHESGALLATGTQTLRWRWPQQEWQESVSDLDGRNTTVTVEPTLLHVVEPRYMFGGLVGIDQRGDMRYGAVAARRIIHARRLELHVIAVGLAGGGDVTIAAGLAGGW